MAYRVRITRAELWGNLKDGFDNNGDHVIADFELDKNKCTPVKIAREYFAGLPFALTESGNNFIGKNSKSVTVEWMTSHGGKTSYEVFYRGQYIGAIDLDWIGTSCKHGLTYTSADVQESKIGDTVLRRLEVDEKRLEHNPLPWQKRGLMYTRTGYGRRIPTENMIRFNGRLHRIYCCIFSNSGTLYIEHKGEWIIVRV